MNNENRVIKFEVCTRRKDGTDLFVEVLTLDDLLDRNGCYYNPAIQEIVYKRQWADRIDKNGKEIYEGDIVQTWFFEVKAEIMIIVVRHGAFYHKDPKSEGYGSFHETSKPYNKTMPNSKYYEVIGNIYQDSELLTK